jgi:hypothetical protein
MSYAPSCIGVHSNALAGLKSRTTRNAPPCGAALNWYTGLAPTSTALAVQVTRWPTSGESTLGARAAVPDNSLRSSNPSTGGRTLVGGRRSVWRETIVFI